MNKLHIALITAVLLTGSAAAQANMQSSGEIDTVILASTANYPDAMVASGPAQSLGTPVLLTDQDQIPESTQQALDRLDPENVVIVGGPAVVSEEVEAEVEANYETTRLWGTTQIGTSVEVADYFWAEAEKATIVQYPQDEDRHQLLAKVKDRAEENPVLVSEEGTLSADVLTKIEDLNVQEVEVYSTNAVDVEQDLTDSGVEEVEVHEEGENRLEDQLQEETSVEGKSQLVIVAAANFKHTISASSTPNSASFIVSNEDQIDEAVTLAAEADSNTTIRVVGKPDLAQDIADSIESETDKEVDHVSGEQAADQAAEAVERDREKWENRQREKMEEWKQNQAEEPTNRALERAREVVNENSSEEAQNALEEAENAFEEGNYFEARKMAVKARSEAKVSAYAEMDAESIREQVREERQGLNEIAEEIRETSQEMADELQEAETPEERREVIRDYREDRRDLIKELREEVREMRGDRAFDDEGTLGDTEPEREEREENESEEDSSQEAKIEVETDGQTVKAEAEYTANTGGYTVERDVSVEEDEVNIVFDLVPPSDDAFVTQALTEYDPEVEEELEPGNYRVHVELRVDGEVTAETSQAVEIE